MRILKLSKLHLLQINSLGLPLALQPVESMEILIQFKFSQKTFNKFHKLTNAKFQKFKFDRFIA